ncbi:MAG: radical SAM protein, partial [Bacillota bacterium]|nr:radical SAM protein [Bacillota bacterium]
MTNIGLISLGCSKNLVDSETMLGLLSENKFKIVDKIEDSDVIIVNTCAFIDSAKQESINTILDAARYKEDGRCKALICAGCLAERYKEEILTELPEVDAVIGVGDYPDIISIINNVLDGKKEVRYGRMNEPVEEGLPRMISTPHYTAFIKIAEGCDNFCSYCAIPYIRGRYRSRRIEDIVNEAKHLSDNGVKEIIV